MAWRAYNIYLICNYGRRSAHQWPYPILGIDIDISSPIAVK